MKTMNRSTKLLVIVTAIAIVMSMWMASAWSREVAAEEYLDEFLAYGVANISPGQTARLHVVTVGIPDAHSAELVIYDRQGNILAHSLQRLRPGKAVALDLRFADHTGIAVGGNRIEFYAEVRFSKLRSGYVIPSLEVIDDTTGITVRMIVDPLG
jgi:hypothetical protein